MLKTPCNAAFKEWASVIRALEAGTQAVLLRKGGISEDDGEFRIQYPEFLLFPTFEHQEPRLLKAAWTPLVAETIRSQDSRGRIAITSFAKVEGIWVAKEREGVRQLEHLYIWNDRYVEGRFHFQPDSPLYVLLLRVYKLSKAVFVEYRSEYGGCRSWIEIEPPVAIEGSRPVIEDERFSALHCEIERCLGPASRGAFHSLAPEQYHSGFSQ